MKNQKIKKVEIISTIRKRIFRMRKLKVLASPKKIKAKMKKKNTGKVKTEIEELFSAAKDIFPKEPELAHRYIELARKKAQSANVRFSSEQRRQYCHNCYHYLYPSKNCDVRIDSQEKMLLHICKDCEHANRFGYQSKES